MINVSRNMRQQISDALGLGSLDLANNRGNPSPESLRRVEPRIEKPSLTNQFLNLFKVNGNYYAQAQPEIQAGLKRETTKDLKDTPGRADQEEKKKADEQVPLQKGQEAISTQGTKNNSEKEQDEEGVCSICCNQGENCIIMDCRHGGLCKVCSIDILKTKGLCPFCRLPINKICVVAKVSDVQYKVLEEIRV